jgi:hypothetical protein
VRDIYQCKHITTFKKYISEANGLGLCSMLQNETWIDVFQENDVEKKWKLFMASLTIVT